MKIPGHKGEVIKAKMDYVFGNNSRFKMLELVERTMSAEEATLPPGMSITDVADLKYAPIISADVECSFSQYKSLLRDNRLHLTDENVSKMVVTHCFFNHNP